MSATKEDPIINPTTMPNSEIYYAAETEHGWGVARNGRIVLREDGKQDRAESVARMLNQFVEAEDYFSDFPKKS